MDEDMQMRRSVQTGPARWISIFFGGWAIFEGIFIALVGLTLKCPIRSLWRPYLLLLWCGLVGGPLIYRARHSHHATPKSGALRFALAIFAFLNLYMGALLLSAVSVGIMSNGSALYEYAPYILLTSILGSIAVYVMARQRLESYAVSNRDNE